MRGRLEKRHVHGLNAQGGVYCNPRDREAAHRAQMKGIATEDLSAVTCSACRTLMYLARRRAPNKA
jgi:hypothetical protein